MDNIFKPEDDIDEFRKGNIIKEKYKIIGVQDEDELFDYVVNLYDEDTGDYTGEMKLKTTIQIHNDLQK